MFELLAEGDAAGTSTSPQGDRSAISWGSSMRFSLSDRADRDDVHARVDAVLRAIMRVHMVGDRVPALTEVAHAEFRSALRDRGTDPEAFHLAVRIDDAAGATAFVLESGGKKRTWSLPEFQAWLSRS